MSSTTTNETRIEADPTLPTIRIVREFDAPKDRVFRAWTDPELVARWLGPKSTTMRIDSWDAHTGGSYRYAACRTARRSRRSTVRSTRYVLSERLVQTFTWEGAPDGVSLETMTFEDIGDGRTRVTGLSVVDTIETRDMVMSSGMDSGVIEGYEKLDALLAEG